MYKGFGQLFLSLELEKMCKWIWKCCLVLCSPPWEHIFSQLCGVWSLRWSLVWTAAIAGPGAKQTAPDGLQNARSQLCTFVNFRSLSPFLPSPLSLCVSFISLSLILRPRVCVRSYMSEILFLFLKELRCLPELVSFERCARYRKPILRGFWSDVEQICAREQSCSSAWPTL